MSQEQQYRGLVYLSDTSGTGFWRKIQHINQLNCISQNTGVSVTYTQFPIIDPGYYNGVNTVTVQRWISDQHMQIFFGRIKPLMERNGGWVFYEIDDNMSDRKIPLFNRGRKSFEGEHVQDNIKKMLLASDFVTVTTDYLKQRYHEMYGVPLENIISVPNLLSRYWFGDRYDPDKKIDEFQKNKRKPRIGIVSSLSHFNVDNVRVTKDGKACRSRMSEKSVSKEKDGQTITWNFEKKTWLDQENNPVKEIPPVQWIDEDGNEVDENESERITDDFDDVSQMIRDTVNDFQWVCFGYCPPQIKDLADKGKIEVHGGVPIINYPSKLENLHLQAIVAPIKKMDFNYCKSFIKTMESAAIGVPLFATNCLPYSRVMDPKMLFDTGDELKEKLMKLKFQTSNGEYRKIIERNWKWLNSPTDEGDFHLKNFWLDDNLGIFIEMFKLRPKCKGASMKFIHEEVLKKIEEEKKNTLMKDEDNGVAIIK